MSYYTFSQALLWSAVILNLWMAYKNRLAWKELDSAAEQMNEALRLLHASPNAKVTIVTANEEMKKRFEDQLRNVK